MQLLVTIITINFECKAERSSYSNDKCRAAKNKRERRKALGSNYKVSKLYIILIYIILVLFRKLLSNFYFCGNIAHSCLFFIFAII